MNDAFVSYPPRIYSLLKQSLQYKLQFSIRHKSSSDYYLTTIIEIDPEFRYIIMDELHPESANQQFGAGDIITIDNQLNRVSLKFDCIIEKYIPGQSGAPGQYLLSYPSEIYYPQQRHFHRLRLNNQDNATCTIYLDENTSLGAICHDISISGICLSLKSDRSLPPLTAGMRFEARIELDELPQISTDIIIRNMRHTPGHEQLLYGVAFIELLPRHQNIIQKYLTRVERRRLGRAR